MRGRWAKKERIPILCGVFFITLGIYHTEDRNLPDRKRLYTEEGAAYYHGMLWIPDDLEMIEM